ncbi:glucuronate isomerase [Yoonia sp. SS1-5]|uniref:Uronate isomerase n=1 Tax=Yoonia rhodophyticola TaxID=3137370 RepID=A0AAN0MDG6_9RHOB
MNDQSLNGIAGLIYDGIRQLPIVSPHGHCDPQWFADDTRFPDPAALLIQPDHYVFRMLYSRGVTLEELGIGAAKDPRDVFRTFAAHWHLFLGTPSRRWLEYSFREVFGLDVPLSVETSDLYFDEIALRLRQDSFRPRALFDRFGIAVLATTDGALDDLAAHGKIDAADWGGRIIPTFRPDSIINPHHPHFADDMTALATLTGTDCAQFPEYLDAIRQRRAFFKQMGATATDHGVTDLQTAWLDADTLQDLLTRALAGELSGLEAARFEGHMLTEMAQMSVEDGLVMQLHVGSRRSTNRALFAAHGPDMGADIPQPVNWVTGLDALLNRVGNNPALELILFTLDETTYARELAPMAGHWPALRLGPPWWFHDSENGIARYLDQVVETAGYWNLAGFNDDTRAFTSIPARHDLWRRGVAVHLGQQVARGRMGRSDAADMAKLLAHDLALESYRLGG